MGVATGRFSAGDRLRHARDFRRVTHGGRRVASEAYVLLVTRGRPGASTRLGLTVSRKVGNAVVRNRVKRRLREWFREARWELRGTWDIVVIARREAADLEFRGSCAQLSRMLAEGTSS